MFIEAGKCRVRVSVSCVMSMKRFKSLEVNKPRYGNIIFIVASRIYMDVQLDEMQCTGHYNGVVNINLNAE